MMAFAALLAASDTIDCTLSRCQAFNLKLAISPPNQRVIHRPVETARVFGNFGCFGLESNQLADNTVSGRDNEQRTLGLGEPE
jgi:hypothetical protein